MGLAQSVVVVNEFSLKTPDGGTKGGTPGDYVLRYMAREGATEAQGPALRESQDAYVVKYMAREGAVESLASGDRARREIRKAGGLGGMAFSESSLSLSDEDLRKRSREIQEAFESGKTVLKTVLSFDTEYLERNRVLPEGFTADHPKASAGYARGQVDQLRLRQAIQRGLGRLAGDYDDLRWVGVIQVDTKYVHCHLAMADMGRGNLMPDGTQRGKLSSAQKASLRRGIDLSLQDDREVQHMASASFLEQRNLKSAVVRHTYGQLVLYGAPQRLLASLPEDSRLWRAGSARAEVREANAICRDYVEAVLRRGGEPVRKAEKAIREYAGARARREGLEPEDKAELVRGARERMILSCMDGVYGQLRAIPEGRRHEATEFLDLASDPALSPDFKGGARDMVYRMGAYGERLRRHRKEASRMDRLCREYETARDAGETGEGSEALYRFFRLERDYQSMTAEKYSRFLFFLPPTDDLAEEFLRVEEEARKAENLQRLLLDRALGNLSPEEAERRGRELYGAYGGRLMVLDRAALEDRAVRLAARYEKDRDAFTARLAARGLDVDADEDGLPSFRQARRYDFDDIRALDLHELRGDFRDGLEYDGKAQRDFLDMARRRSAAFDGAAAYLRSTGQEALVADLNEEDVEAQRRVAGLVEEGLPVPPVFHAPRVQVRRRVPRLDTELHEALSAEIVRRAGEAAPEAPEGMRQAGS